MDRLIISISISFFFQTARKKLKIAIERYQNLPKEKEKKNYMALNIIINSRKMKNKSYKFRSYKFKFQKVEIMI